MKKRGKEEDIIGKVGEFETHHKVIFFLFVMLLTIGITRLMVYYLLNPKPNIFGFELHHFDYGLVLMILTILFMIFIGKYHKTYLIFSAISLGLIIDELWFIRKQIGGDAPEIYNPSLIYVILIAVFVSLIAFLITKLFKIEDIEKKIHKSRN
jgi:hypothetical protein